MVPRIAILLTLAAHTACGDINLTPIATEYTLDGARFAAVVFRDGGDAIVYTPPEGWQRSGSTKLLRLEPPGSAYESAILEATPVECPITLSKSGIIDFAELAVTLAPASATDIRIIETVIDPVRIAGYPTIETTLGYAAFGQRFITSILFMTRGAEQLRFTVTARATEFQKVRTAFRNSLYSFEGL